MVRSAVSKVRNGSSTVRMTSLRWMRSPSTWGLLQRSDVVLFPSNSRVTRCCIFLFPGTAVRLSHGELVTLHLSFPFGGAGFHPHVLKMIWSSLVAYLYSYLR